MFHHDAGTTVVHKRMSFLSVLILGATTVTVTLIACAGGLAAYGLRVADKKSDSVLGFIQQAAENLPELQRSLPPALADAINDERRPGYVDDLAIEVRLSRRQTRGRESPAIVEVQNQGDKVVSLLSMRLVAIDQDGDASQERSVWISTPLQAGGDWRGPLLPRETRRLLVWGFDRAQTKELSHEITDLRVWRNDDPPPTAAKASRTSSHGKENADKDA